MSLAISQWHTWLPYSYSWLNTLHTLLNLFRLIYPHIGSSSFAATILRKRKCLTISSHARTSHSHKSKNPRWTSFLAIHQNLSLQKHFLPQLGKAASHHRQVITMNFRSLLYKELPWNFPSSPKKNWMMSMRMRLMMSSVPPLNNLSTLQIMV